MSLKYSQILAFATTSSMLLAYFAISDIWNNLCYLGKVICKGHQKMSTVSALPTV